MDSTIRKKVLSVSISSEAAWKKCSSSSRNHPRIFSPSSYIFFCPYMFIIVSMSPSDQPSSSSLLSYASSLTRKAFAGSRSIASRFSLSFSSWYFLMSKVCCSTREEVALHTGERIPLIVPSTIVGKNMMQRPSTKGRNRGNTSIGSARARDCHTR